MRSRQKLRRMRSTQVLIALTALAVPVTAYALTGATPAAGDPSQNTQSTLSQNTLSQNTLSLRVSPRVIPYGSAVSIAGAAPVTDAGRQVVLQIAGPLAAGWQQLATTTIGASGRFGFRTKPERSGLLRALVTGSAPVSAGESTVTTGAAAAPSGPISSVTVMSRFHLTAPNRDLLSGSPLHVSGRLLPAVAGRLVRLQAHSAAGWRTFAGARTGRRGGFRVGYVPGAGVDRRLRVLFDGDRANARATGSAGTFTVYGQSVASWYYDAGSTACGFHAGLGVANVSLPCGTRVRFRYGGRQVTAVVDDRGPYVGGRQWDLNQNTAAALGFAGVGTVWSSS
jgi:rare lipoprotein A